MISVAAKYLETLYDELNTRFFDGKVQKCVITIRSTPSAYGHCSLKEIWDDNGEKRHEINIGAETLNRDIENVCATLIHEMTHLFNIANGVKDVSRGCTYHNKNFKEEAEKHGIKIDHHEKYGWTLTTPGEDLIAFIKEKGWGKVGMNRGELIADNNGNGAKPVTGTVAPVKKSSSRKYVCPKCGAIIRATKEVHMMCADCNEMMVEA